jgi:hypothetical protein
VRLQIVGTNLPGRECCQPGGVILRDVHVGIQIGREPAELVVGDAKSARWVTDIRVVSNDGELDFRGPAVQGKRGDRFVYLTWGDLGHPGMFAMFRRAKLMLNSIPPALVDQAEATNGTVVGTVGLTDRHGMPLCAAVRPPVIAWTVG